MYSHTFSYKNANSNGSQLEYRDLNESLGRLWTYIVVLTTNMNPNLMQNDISNYTSIAHLLWIIIDKWRVMITHINASRGPIWGQIIPRQFIFGCVHARMSHWAMLRSLVSCMFMSPLSWHENEFIFKMWINICPDAYCTHYTYVFITE